MGDKIKFYNGYTQSLEEESIHGERFLRLLYGSKLGKLALNQVIKRKLFSRIYGYFMRHGYSRRKIKPFIERYKIDSSMFEKKVEDFISFDDFFTRRLNKTARPIAVENQKLIFPCDGRHLLIENIKKLPSFFVKGQKFNLKSLLQNEELLARFKDGQVLISRLCPTDYHRFHFPCNAIIRKIYRVNGDYLSVNPIATKKRIAIFFENKRIISVLQTEDVDQFLMIEVGATCVGSITQTAEVGRLYFKGEEKGYFSFGGSTVIAIFQKNKVNFSEDLRKNSENGIETFALMGDAMGVKI
jgi:phosphatidylserine decarboxylase